MSHPFARLLSYAAQFRGAVLRAALSSLWNKLFDLAPPVLIGTAVDIVVNREESTLAAWGLTDTWDQLVVLAVATVTIWALESLFEYLQKWIWRNLAQRVEHRLRIDTYAHVQRLDLQQFMDRSTGGLMAIINDDINQLERFLDDGADNLIQVATSTVAIVIAFFLIAPSVAWMAMAPIPFIVWGSFKYQRLLAPRYSVVRERVGDLNGQLGNNLSGIATIKSYTAEEHEVARIGGLSEAYLEANRRAIALSSAFSPLIRMVIVAGFTATLVWGGHLAINGELGVGTYSVLVFMTQRLLWPLTRLGQTFDLYQRAQASTTRIMDLLDTPIRIVEGTRSFPEPVRGAITFDDVSFAYGERAPLFEGFDLEIGAGSTVGIVGSTGAGKTTVVNLLLRFYDPTSGRVLIDGEDVSELTFEDLRGAIALVSQHAFLFSGTVAENIAYGTFEASPAQIEEAAEKAGAMEFIRSLPQGLETMVGERGLKLSGGQRQRLSIARALLSDAPILILDEATSAVDNETELAIQRSLADYSRERTTLIIAHRLSTVRNADFIVVLEEGRVRERGTHDELVELGGTYARLWSIQTGAVAA